MAVTLDGLLRSKAFLAGLAIRTLLIALSLRVVDAGASAWPIESTTGLMLGGTRSWLYSLEGLPAVLASLGYFLSLLVADVTCLVGTLRLAPREPNLVVALYWLSPLVLLTTYWQGEPVVIPLALLVISLCALQRNQLGMGGTLLGAAGGAVTLVLWVVPIVGIFIWQSKRLRPQLRRFWVGSVCGFCLVLFVCLGVADAYRERISASVVYDFSQQIAFQIRGDYLVFIVPLIYSLVLYAMWRLRRTNFEVLTTIIGLTVLAMSFASFRIPGTFLLLFPPLLIYASQTTLQGKALIAIFFFLIFVVGVGNSELGRVSAAQSISPVATQAAYDIFRVWPTVTLLLGIVIGLRMLGEGVIYNKNFRASRRPLVIGVAGDSGSGKDTLAKSLTGLFGEHSVTTIFGDSYHKWARGAPMWRALTHLNPKANDLSGLARDVIAVVSGETVMRRHYDHRVGRFTSPIKIFPNDVVIVSGLHALFQPYLRERLDVKIFLEADPKLRMHWKLQRDTGLRNQSLVALRESVAVREPDVRAYVAPQARQANIVFSLMPLNERLIDADAPPAEIPLKLRVRMRDAMDYEALIRCLIAICGLQIEWEISEEGNTIDFVVEGEVSAEDISLCAYKTLFQYEQFLDINPIWMPNMGGVMQLVVLTYINQTLRKRGRE